MKKHFLLTFLILQSICSLAQNENLILTENANDLWFQNLITTNDLSEKIGLINQRLIEDVNVYIEWNFPDGITVQRIPKLDSIRRIRNQGFCKPLYVIRYKNNQIPFRIENPLNKELTYSVTKLITENNVCDIEVRTDDEKKSFYGTSANCGIIFIKTEKRKVFNAFKNLKLTNLYMDEIRSY